MPLNRMIVLVLVIGLIFVIAAIQPVSASDNYDDHPPAERFKLRFGAFFIGSFDTNVRFDSRTVPIGTSIDLEDSFNVDSRETVGRLDGFYRFNKRHRIDWTYYSSRRDGYAISSQEIIIGDPDDPDGKDVIPVGAEVMTNWNFDLLKLGYAWSFLNKRDYEWYIGAGLNIQSVEIDIAYQADLPGTLSVEQDSVDAKGTLPLPTATVGGRYQMSKKWQANVRYELFLLELGDYRGSRQEFLASFEHNTFRHVGFGAGLNMVNMDFRAKTDQIRGKVDSGLLGLMGYLKVYY